MTTSQADVSSNRGCLPMVVGALVTGLALMLWVGAGINKTSTGLLEPLLAIIGLVVLAVGVVRRMMWVRGSD